MKLTLCVTLIFSFLFNLVKSFVPSIRNKFFRKTASGMIRSISGLFRPTDGKDKSAGSLKRSDDPALLLHSNEKGELCMMTSSEVYGEKNSFFKKNEVGLGLCVLDVVSSAFDSVGVLFNPLSKKSDLHGAQTIKTQIYKSNLISNIPDLTIAVKSNLKSKETFTESSIEHQNVAGYMDFDVKEAALKLAYKAPKGSATTKNSAGAMFVQSTWNIEATES